MTNLRETLLSKKALVKEIQLEGFGTVYIRKMFGDRHKSIGDWWVNPDISDEVKQSEVDIRWVIASVCDAEGTYAFTEADIPLLKQCEWVGMLARDILEFNGFDTQTPEEDGEQPKN